MKSESNRTLIMLWLLSFFQGMAPGFWVPSITNVLKAQGLEGWVALTFAVAPVCALFSPLIGGALADEKISAQKLMGYTSILSGFALFCAFYALDLGINPWWFITGMAFYSVTAGPTWGLLANISLSNLNQVEKNYPRVRLGATLGWMAAGYTTSYILDADDSLMCGYAAVIARLCAGVLAFFAPDTPPQGKGKSWRSALGMDAFRLYQHRDHAVLFIVTGLFAIPLTAFYMYSGEMFEMLGDSSPTASVTAGQWAEILMMPILGALMMRYRLKTLLLWGLGLSAVRFGLCGISGYTGQLSWHLAGVALHGVCFTIYFITIQIYLDRNVEPALRSQAQGMLGLMSAGIGPLVGALFCGWLREICVDENGQGWAQFWWILAALITCCFFIFSLFYRGNKLHKPLPKHLA